MRLLRISYTRVRFSVRFDLLLRSRGGWKSGSRVRFSLSPSDDEDESLALFPFRSRLVVLLLDAPDGDSPVGVWDVDGLSKSFTAFGKMWRNCVPLIVGVANVTVCVVPTFCNGKWSISPVSGCNAKFGGNINVVVDICCGGFGLISSIIPESPASDLPSVSTAASPLVSPSIIWCGGRVVTGLKDTRR